MLEINKIYNINCLDGLKMLNDNSIDSIVTDPPYELGFMGKEWDKTGIAYNIEVWKECLRVLKPGGHLLAFGGARTYHRMACAIEDAGFEIRDCIMWIYGQGFSKGQDISKAIDKLFGVEREAIGIDEYRAKRIPHGRNKNNEGWNYGVDKRAGEDFKITVPATPEAKQWEGWNTTLKPAHEPIVLARKPISEKNIVLNVLRWGTGGLNINGCRIGTDIMITNGRTDEHSTRAINKGFSGNIDRTPRIGRFPANVILDEEAAKILDEQSGISKSTGGRSNHAFRSNQRIYGKGKDNIKHIDPGYGDVGGASRYFKIIDYDEKDYINFFYCAKASKKERGEFNNHPAVKPLRLIKYLVKLVTPPGGIVLDPFIGSGTTVLACIDLGFNYIGFELESTYCDIASKRIDEYLKNRTA